MFVNIGTKRFTAAPGNAKPLGDDSRAHVIFGSIVPLDLTLTDSSGEPLALAESDTFVCGGDINFIHTDSLMFFASASDVTIIDAATGVIRVKVDATAAAFGDKATAQKTMMHVQLKRFVVGDTIGETLLQDYIYADPAVITVEGKPETPAVDYYTAAQTLALLRAADELQYTADPAATVGHYPQIDGDTHKRRRNSAAAGEWGPWELIEVGPQGAAGAIVTDTPKIEFTTTADTGTTVTLTAAQLGTDGQCELDVLDANGYNISASSSLSRRWTASGYELTWTGGWPAGTYSVKPRGIQGLGQIDDPAMTMPVLDADWGDCRYLDDVTPLAQYAARMHDVVRIELELVSADATVAGNVVLVPVVGGVDASPVVIAVGATPARAVIELAVDGATLALRRDYSHESDTLKADGDVISTLLMWSRLYTRKY